MKPIVLSPISLALGALVAVGLFIVMGQASPASYASWGPPKKGIVNIFEPQQSIIPGNGTLTIYQVPTDRWLTVTSVSLNASNLDRLRWSEVLGGTVQDKGFAAQADPFTGGAEARTALFTPEAAGGTIGWVFRPGSQVVLRNTDNSPAYVYRHALLGYETRD